MIDKHDRQNLFDLHDVIQALAIAQEALRKAMQGQGQAEREAFTFQIGFARGRLERVADRMRGVEDVPDAP